MKFPRIPQIDLEAEAAARARQLDLTKPPGSLGRLEALSIQLASITSQVRPSMARKAVIVMAGDHGVTQEGICSFPPEVTPQMVLNFLHGGAAVNVLSRLAGARVTVVDIGVAYDFTPAEGLIIRRVARGTQNMAWGPAMTRQQAEEAIQAGIDVVQDEYNKGLDVVAIGEMGIGNTTPSAAMTAVFTGLPVEKVTGRGTGLDDEGLGRKVEVIEKAISVNKPDSADPLDVLSKVGGFEIAGMAGVVLGAAALRIPVVIDGFISGVAALTAAELVPAVKPYLIASHQSVEIGHRAVLEKIGITPLFTLDLRLGEGTGAVLAFHLVEAAARILSEMATFSEAGVSGQV